jgi:hypothetical protein
MEVCNRSVSNQQPCFLINVKDRKAIRLAINLAKWESASWQNITSTEIVKYGHAVQSLYYFFYLYLAYKRTSK